MRTSVSLAASLCLFFLSTAGPVQAESSYDCPSKCVPTLMSVIVKSGSNGHDVPHPTRRGNFIGHFDANGVPQSIVTPVDSYEEIVEVPCEDNTDWYPS